MAAETLALVEPVTAGELTGLRRRRTEPVVVAVAETVAVAVAVAEPVAAAAMLGSEMLLTVSRMFR